MSTGRAGRVLAALGLGLCAAACTHSAGVGPEVLDTPRQAKQQIIVAVHDEPSRLMPRAGSVSRPYSRPRSYRGTPQSRRQLARLAREYELITVTSWPIEMLGLYCVVYEVPQGRSREALLAEIETRPGVVVAQPMQEFTTLVTQPPGVPDSAASAARLDLRRAQQWATGRDVKVAVIDTGIDGSHPALAGAVIRQIDFVGRRADASGNEAHGTAVAGVIAARTDPELGPVGVAPAALLLALRACWHTDPGSAVCNSLTLARAIAAAVEEGAKIINLSLTGPPDPLLERLLMRAIADNLIVVGALPDEGWNGSTPQAGQRFPTSVPGVIRVQTAELGQRSNPGTLPAPGREVLTLRPGAGIGLASGSSLAAAHVTGMVALLVEHREALDARQAHAMLSQHVRPLELAGRRRIELVDACLLIASLADGFCPPERTRADAEQAERPPQVSLPRD